MAGGEDSSRKDTRSHRRQPDTCRGNAGNQPPHHAKQDPRVRLAAQEVRIACTTTTPIMQLLQGYLKVTSDRQQLIASNIANVDTPGYQTKDINFQTAMQQVTNEGDGVQLHAGIVEVQGLPERPDGNNVNVDARGFCYRRGTAAISNGRATDQVEFHRLLTAIKEGN